MKLALLFRSLEFELDARVDVSRHSSLCRRIVLLTTFSMLQHCSPAVSPLSKGKGNQLPIPKIIRPVSQ